MKDTNDVLSGVHVSRRLFGRLVFHAPWPAAAQIYHLTFCVATRMRTWRLLSKKKKVGVWAGMLVFDLVSFFVLPARCHNHNTSSVSQVVHILLLLRTCHLLLLLTQMVFASKMWLLRGAQRVMMFGGAAFSECVVLTCRVVRGRLFRAKNKTKWFICHPNADAQQLFRQVRSLYTTEAPNVWCTLECVSCESPVLALAGWRTGVLAPACALSFTQ